MHHQENYLKYGTWYIELSLVELFGVQNKGINIWLMLVAMLFTSSIVHSQTYEIAVSEHQQNLSFQNDLTENTSLTFTLNKNQSVLIKASQSISDVSLTVYKQDDKSSHLLFTQGSPSNYRQPEYLYLNHEDCNRCIVLISASKKSDTHGNFELSFERHDIDRLKTHSILKSYNQAIQKWHSAESKNETKEYSSLLNETLQLLKEVTAQASKSQNEYWIWFSLYQQSIVYHFMGEYQNQERILLELVQLVPSENSHYTRLLLDIASHEVYENNDFDKAKQHIDHILNVTQSTTESLIRAETLELSASINIENGLYTQAVSAYIETIDIFLNKQDYFSAINSMISLGWFYYKNGELLKANERYQSALLLAEQIEDVFSITNANIKLATVYRHLGDYDKSDKYIESAMSLSSTISHGYLDGWAKQQKAFLLRDTGQYLYALSMFDQSRAAFEKLGAKRNIKELDYHLGNMFLEVNEYAKAENYLNEYLAYLREEGTSYKQALVISQLANIYAEKGEFKEALLHQKSAYVALQKTSDIGAIGRSQMRLAFLYSHELNASRAKKLFEQAKQNLMQANDEIALILGMYKYATSFYHSSPTDALNNAQLANTHMKNVYNNLKRTDLKRGYLANFQDLNSLIIDLSPNYSSQQSLVFAESVRGETLESRMRVDKTRLLNSHPFQAQYKLLSQALQQHLIAVKHSQTKKIRSQNLLKASQTSEEIYKLETQIYAPSAIAKSKSAFTEQSIIKLQQMLSQDEMLIFFDTAEFASHIWYVDQQNVIYQKSKPASFFAEQVKTLLSRVDQKLTEVYAIDEAKSLSESIFSSQVLPIIKSKKRLIIIPDGALSNLPFALLSLPHSNSPLLETMSLRYHHSLSLFVKQMQKTPSENNTNKLLLIANPAMDASASSAGETYGFTASELPYTALEANNIKAFANEKLVFINRENATKKNLLDQPLSTFDIIHFATHGLANNQIPEIGGLVLSNVGTSNNLLLAPEIKQLSLKAQLVVLSGCETTKGYFINGDGLLGLSMAFMESGASNVIGSLWKVQDAATATLMSKFYENILSLNMPIDIALAKAQQYVKNYKRKDGRKPWVAPFYWAGFVLHGTAK